MSPPASRRGARANHKFLADWVRYAPEINENEQLLLCDAQTSGGLLAAVPESAAGAVVGALSNAGTLAAAIIGRVDADGDGRINVTPTRN